MVYTVKTTDCLVSFCPWLYDKRDEIWTFYFFFWGGTKSLGTAATSGLLHKAQMIDESDCGATGGMKIGRGNRSTLRKPAPAPLCPPQIPHDQTRARTRAAAVGSQRLTASAMGRPRDLNLCSCWILAHLSGDRPTKQKIRTVQGSGQWLRSKWLSIWRLVQYANVNAKWRIISIPFWIG
jgi:hypothetical protein